jgi:hypothetical protein
MSYISQTRRAKSSGCPLVEVSWRSSLALVLDRRDKKEIESERRGGEGGKELGGRRPHGRFFPGFSTKILGKGSK